MPSIVCTVDVPFSAQQMFALVHDIDSYPAFLPWCRDAEIIGHGDQELTASLLLHRGGVESRFSTRNRFVAGERIEMELLNGPFEYLRGRWQFIDMEEGAEVSLDMRYRFANPLLGFMMAAVVDDITAELVTAFEDRAHDVYGLV